MYKRNSLHLNNCNNKLLNIVPIENKNHQLVDNLEPIRTRYTDNRNHVLFCYAFNSVSQSLVAFV